MNKVRPNRLAIAIICAILGLGMPLGTCSAITMGHSNTFDGGSLGAWQGSRASTPGPVNVAGGGPAGDDDSFMEVKTSGFHLATFNGSASWQGDYIAAGVEAIAVDFKRIASGTELRMQVSFHGQGGMFVVPQRTEPLPDNEWVHHIFDVRSENLLHVSGGTGAVEDTMRNVNKVLIRHDRTPATPAGFHPPHIVATVGMDNITATCLQTSLSDLNGDCVTDFRDFALFADGWLE